MAYNPFQAQPGTPESYFNQIPSTVKPYYNPYIKSGQTALDALMGQYGQLVNDPAGFMKSLGSTYEQSPGYQYQMNQAMNAANNAAASGGYLGTPYHQQNAAGMASNLANQDYYNYLGNVLGQYNTGLSGYSGINQMGYGASNEFANTLGNNLMNQGNMAYLREANRNQASANRSNSLWSGLGALTGGVGSLLSNFKFF